MCSANSKKTAILCIIYILKKHTDSEHTLTQKQIHDMHESEYGLKLDRKAVKRNAGRGTTDRCRFRYNKAPGNQPWCLFHIKVYKCFKVQRSQ